MRAWSAFRFGDFRLLWLASVASIFTTELRLLASGVALYQITGSAAQLGLLGAVQLVVQVPALLYGGTLADRVDRKRLMAGTQAVTLAAVVALALLAAAGALLPWHIYVTTAVLSVTAVFGNPARAALLPATVPRDHLVPAVTMSIASQQVASIAAPLAFAGVVAFINLTTAFFVTVAVAIPAVALPLMMRVNARPVPSATKTSTARQTWEGLRFVRTHALLPGLYTLDAGVTVVSFYRQMFPVIADQLFGGGEAVVGLLTSANSIGAVGGSFLMLWLGRYKRTGMMVIYATLVYAVLLVPFALIGKLWVGMFLIAGLGAMDAVSVTARQATVQLTTPDGMLGRALSLQTLAAQTSNNVGTLYVGFMAAAIGVANTFLIGGGVSLAFTLAVWRGARGLRNYRAA